ncbi:glycosyltransferase family 2 protein [Glaciecola sp. SC05]|uniref:glycosyltransferase family 2 protein n=1 Tax=Glaciecola sp. SC05 TaxID=1987355 RepID=UPI003528E8E6
MPASFYRRPLPDVATRQAKTGHLTLEIVSHCWQYSHMLVYQLSSFVNYPPKDLSLTVTVFYSPEDVGTQKTLDMFGKLQVENVIWNWQPMEKPKLVRRAIGRNMSALATKADWIWFTDCDIIFHENCLDSLASQLQGKTDTLYFPKEIQVTDILEENDPLLQAKEEPQVIDVDTNSFQSYARQKAIGPYQIVHGDVARAIGYCDEVRIFQTESDRWRKTYEDTAFRWLVGSDGVPIAVDGVFQIRHIQKGRYDQNSKITEVRIATRKVQKKIAD